ncbi:MAG: serine hydrolase [Anaerolineae bacterium]|nr:serine hydrolase [Anaerolineae bacterium]
MNLRDQHIIRNPAQVMLMSALFLPLFGIFLLLSGRLHQTVRVGVPAQLTSLPGTLSFTPSPPVVVTNQPAWVAPPDFPLNNRLEALSHLIYDYLLARRFVPDTQQVGSVFLLDLNTGENYSIYPEVAYSGMSLIKIPILVAVYRKIGAIPTMSQAQDIALMIICSENLSANQLLSFLGDGDIYRGADLVTETMQALGLQDTFLTGSLWVGDLGIVPVATVPPLPLRKTNADQRITEPDGYNQTTPADLGWLLAGIYQCALDGTGPLTVVFPEQLTMQKCRAMLQVLRANDIPALIRAGVPAGLPVAHKHGWVNEVHGDAGIIFSPGGEYVLVVMLRNKMWLEYGDSFPTIAEISRMVYNTFNPAEPLDNTHTESIPLCSLGSISSQLFTDLRSGSLPPIR